MSTAIDRLAELRRLANAESRPAPTTQPRVISSANDAAYARSNAALELRAVRDTPNALAATPGNADRFVVTFSDGNSIPLQTEPGATQSTEWDNITPRTRATTVTG